MQRERRSGSDGGSDETGFLDRWSERIVLAAAARPWRVLGTLILLMLVAGTLAATRLGIDTDSSRMLSPDLPFQKRAQAVNHAFPEIKNTILIVVRSRNADAADAATAAIEGRLEADSVGIESVFAPSVDPFLVGHGILYGSVAEVSKRLSRLSQSANLLAELRQNRTVEGFLDAVGRAVALSEGAKRDPTELSPLLGEAARVIGSVTDGDPRPFDWSSVATGDPAEAEVTRVVTVQPRLDYARLNPARTALDTVRREIGTLDPSLARLVDVGVTGDPALRAEELHSVTSNLLLSEILSVVLVALVTWAAIRTLGRVLVALGTVFIVILLTTGVAAVAVGTLNLISVSFVVLMVGLGVDFAIHLLAHLDEDMRLGVGVREALSRTARSIGGAMMLSGATTVIAFLAFTTTDFVGMAQLGIIGGAGIAIAVAVALTFIPAVVALRPKLGQGVGPMRLPVPRRRAGRAWSIAALIIGLGAIALLPSARFDADPMSLRDPTSPAVVTYRTLASDPAIAPLRMSVLAPDAAAAGRIAATAKAIPGVRNAVWLGSLVPDHQQEKLDLLDLAAPSLDFALGGEAVDLAPRSGPPLVERLRGLGTQAGAALAARIEAWRKVETPARDVALGEALFRFFPRLLDRLKLQENAGPVTEADLPAPLARRFLSPGGTYRVEISASGDLGDWQTRTRFVKAVTHAIPEAAGPPEQIVKARTTVSRAMVTATIIAFAGSAVMALLVLRSASLLAAIMVPMGLSGAVVMAASVLLDIPFNYANVIVLPLMIGIGVDAGIHLAVRTSRSGASVSDTSTPRAVAASALTTIAAFGTLGISAHRGTASMGIMLTIAMVASVLMIFALTPAIVRMTARWRGGR